MMKKNLCLYMLLVLVLSLTACGGASSTTPEQEEPAIPLTETEIRQMYTDADLFKGRPLELTGQIFTDPEYSKDGVYFQIYADPSAYEKNTIIMYPDPTAELSNNDYVRITGTVQQMATFKNMMGAKISAPAIRAENVEILSYKDAVVPTRYVATAVEPTQEQCGYSVTIDQVELADMQTRIYVTVTNNGSGHFSLYEFNTKLLQNGKQYEHTYDFDAEYPEIQTDLMPGITTEGIMVFPAIENAPFQIIMEARSDNWKEDIEPYVFDLTVQ